MRRKIAKIGPSTLMVSLPSDFVKRNYLKKGEEVEVAERGSELRISVVRGVQKERAVIRVKKGERFLRRYLTMLYTQGFNEVEISFEGIPQFDLVNGALDELLGFEVIDQRKNYCLVKNVAQELDSELSQIIRRCFLIISEMADDSLNALRSMEWGRLRESKTFEKTLDKLTYYCKRVLNTRGSREYRELTHLFLIIDYLEQIGDAYYHMCEDVCKKRIKVEKNTLLLFKSVNKLFKEVYALFYNFDKKRIYKFKEKRIYLMDCLKKELYKQNNSIIPYYLLSITEKIMNIELSLTYI